MNIELEIERIFDENGIDISKLDDLESIDSIQYITIVVEIEQFFNIILPDYFLAENIILDIRKLINIVTELYESSKGVDTSNSFAMLSNDKGKFDID